MAGLSDRMAADPWLTLKPLISVATSLPVVIVTVRPPSVVVGLIVMLTVAAVALETVRELTVIPVPK